MHKKNNQLVFSPSDLTVYMDSPFDSWMDRYDEEFPGEFIADEADAGTKILLTHGDKHEKAFLQQLKDRGLDVIEITGFGERQRKRELPDTRQSRTCRVSSTRIQSATLSPATAVNAFTQH